MWRCFYIVVLLLLAFLVIPHTMTTPTCTGSTYARIIGVASFGWLLALCISLGPVLWSLIGGRTEPAFKRLAGILAFFKQQYSSAPTLTLIMWTLLIWASYNALLRYSPDEHSPYIDTSNPSGNETAKVVTITDRLTGRLYRKSFSLDERIADENANSY
jgi:hypothetical protein